jgi:serine/threonine protein kinase
VHETRVALDIPHPHLSGARDLGVERGQPFLLLELMEGGSLDQRLVGDGLTTAQVARLAEGILAGLSHLHEQGSCTGI